MHKNIIFTPSIEAKDPIPTLIEKLSSENNIKVKIQTDQDNILLEDRKKNSIYMESNLNNSTASAHQNIFKQTFIINNSLILSFSTVFVLHALIKYISLLLV